MRLVAFRTTRGDMAIRGPSHWGITTRLVMIACVPALLMFLVIAIALYVSGQADAAKAVRERGTLIANSLARTGQYGLVSGNSASLQHSIQSLVDSDPSIASIRIVDSDSRLVAEVVSSERELGLAFDSIMRSDVLALDLLDNSDAGAQIVDRIGAATKGRVIGKVTVYMSSAPMVQARRDRIVYSATALLLAAIISVSAGLTLAQRLRDPLRAIMASLRQIRQGRFEVTLPLGASGELGELQSTIHEMAQGLRIRREELEAVVVRRTADLQLAVEQARCADAERRRLLARSNRQLEDERKRIAVEIHDHLNATLIGLRSKAQHIAELADGMNHWSAKELHTTATEITQTIASLYKSARNLIKQLRPEVIDVLGLSGALQEMVREYNQLVPSIRFSLYMPYKPLPMRSEVAIVAYRLVQEALSNAVKHSSANRVEVSLIAPPAHDELLISVRDNGIGFDIARVSRDSLGLAGMRERVSGLRGVARVRSSWGRGTRVIFRLPLTSGTEEN